MLSIEFIIFNEENRVFTEIHLYNIWLDYRFGVHN